MVECKFRVVSITVNEWAPNSKQVRMCGVQSEPFGTATPSAEVNMLIAKEEAAKQFEIGKEYKVTFEKVE